MREMLASTSADEPSFLPVDSCGTSKSGVIGVDSATQPSASATAASAEESSADDQLAELLNPSTGSES